MAYQERAWFLSDWTLVRTGVLYRSLGYYVKGGELYVEYDKSRKAVVKYLSQRAGFHVLDVSKNNLIEMAARVQARRLLNFIDILKKGYRAQDSERLGYKDSL